MPSCPLIYLRILKLVANTGLDKHFQHKDLCIYIFSYIVIITRGKYHGIESLPTDSKYVPFPLFALIRKFVGGLHACNLFSG